MGFSENINPVQKVDKQEDKPFEEEQPIEVAGEEVEQYRVEAQKFVDSHRRLLMTYTKDVSLSFKISNGFFIDLENGEVNLDAGWFAEKGCSQSQILWGCLHELEHFRDLDADPEGVMKNFEYIKTKAKKTGQMILKKWEEKFGESDPEFVEELKKQKPIDPKDPKRGTMSAVERAAYKIHHTFYNILDDINDNNNVSRKAPAFEKGRKGGKETERLYQEKLFSETDYSKLPRHLQLMYKLIREEMVDEEEVIVREEVAGAMKQKIMFQGREYTPKEIVENFIKPKKNRNTLASQRHFVARKTLELIFEEFLAKDLEDWDPQKPQKQSGEPQEGEGGEGEPGNPFEDDYKDYDKSNPDQIPEKDIRGWMDKNENDKQEEKDKKARKAEQENKSPEERAEEAQEAMDRNWCEKNNVDFSTFRKFKRIEQEVEPYLQELSKLWQRIIYGSSRKIEREVAGHFKTGTEMDIQKVIEEWPKIEQKKFEDAKVMKRMSSKETLIQMPELIRVRLVGDMSGSMDDEKRHVLQQCFVLILSSIREFNTHLNLTRSQTKSKLKADTEGWIFGNKAEKVKRMKSESGSEDEQAEIVKIFEKLEKTIGGTYDNKALEAIQDSLSQEELEKISRKKIMEIVLEITDGGSSDEGAARKAVDQLSDSGIIARGFQIGETSQEEKDIFNKVWNESRENPKGEIVGEDISNLIPAITAALKSHLSTVKL